MHPGWLVFGGFLLGTAGMKVAQSKAVHKACVRVTACGLECKDYVEHVVDETKAQCDDIMAEAQALKAEEDASRNTEAVVIEETVVKIDE